MDFTPEKIKNLEPIDQEKIKRLVLWAKGEKQYPVVAELYPSWRCNLKCVYCYNRNKEGIKSCNKGPEIEDWISIIHELGKAKVKRIIFAGKESLCKPGIERIFEAVKKENIEGILITNGTLFNEKLIKLLVDLKWDSIAFSLDSTDPKTNDMLRGKGSFEKIIKSIKMFSDLKKDKFFKPYLTINTVLTNKNYKDLPDLVKLANDLKCTSFAVIPLVAYHKEGQKLLIKKRHEISLQKYLKEAYRLTEEYGIRAPLIKELLEKGLSQINNHTHLTSKPQHLTHRNNKKLYTINNPAIDDIKFNPICFHHFTVLALREDGAIIPCPNEPEIDIKWERSEKNKSLDSVWFGETFTRFRESMLRHEIPHCCSTCHLPKILETKRLKYQVRKFITKEKGSIIL